MALLSRALTALTGKATNVQRPSVGGPALFGGFGGGASPQGTLASLSAYGNVGWLFAIVSRLANGTASVSWRLYQRQGGGERKEIPPGQGSAQAKALWALWERPNPFYSRYEFIETIQQHLDLVGEAWWLLLRPENAPLSSPPVEMWPLRPDRIAPVRDAQEFIRGYVYRVGGEAVPLQVSEVVQLKLPNPLDLYRGMGPVQAILADLDAERFTAQWNRNFFLNSAEPGGVIELGDVSMDDADWELFNLRWREQHQGVANAHRVAVLERGHWVDRKYTQRDMQFKDLRMLNRDLIMGAFGFPKHLLGIAEDVNRANAEAAEVMFSRWLIRPRAARIKGAGNGKLAPMFAPDLELDYDDPTPEDEEAKRLRAETGSKTGALMQNEIRGLLGFGDIPGGDVVVVPPGVGQLSLKDEGWTSDLERLERRMRGEWARRLATERDKLIAALEESQ